MSVVVAIGTCVSVLCASLASILSVLILLIFVRKGGFKSIRSESNALSLLKHLLVVSTALGAITCIFSGAGNIDSEVMNMYEFMVGAMSLFAAILAMIGVISMIVLLVVVFFLRREEKSSLLFAIFRYSMLSALGMWILSWMLS